MGLISAIVLRFLGFSKILGSCDLDADIFMVAQGAKEFRKEPLARISINKVQQGSSVASSEGQTHVAIHAPDSGLINQRWRIIRPGNNLIRVADE